MAEEKKKGEDHEELKKAYAEAKIKYNLIPNYEELDREFEISVIDPDRAHFIVKDVKNAICAKIHKFIDNLAPVINPQPSSLHSMVEVKLFEKEEVNDMFAFYKRLMHLLHKSILMALKSEADEANFINDLWKEWPQIKNKMTAYIVKITEGWSKEDHEENNNEYLS